MIETEKEIVVIINQETNAWDTQNIEQLVNLFHHDMVWPWPPTSNDHDPINWVSVMGRFNKERWIKIWQELFDTHELVHNKREIKKIVVTEEQDGAFAIVDIDTLWIDKNGNKNHWLGRTCKVYSKLETGWKMIMQTGALIY